jgi:hypothetical protein
MHLGDYGGVVDELDVAGFEACLKHVVAHHVEFQTAGLPESVHNLEELQHQVVLLQIVTTFEKEL